MSLVPSNCALLQIPEYVLLLLPAIAACCSLLTSILVHLLPTLAPLALPAVAVAASAVLMASKQAMCCHCCVLAVPLTCSA